MKAALATAYGGPEVIRIAEVPTPTPKPNELLMRIHASAVNAADWRLRRANPWFVRLIFGPFKPRKPILGVVFAGEVVETGTAPVINTGIAHREPGVGMVGAGLVKPPENCFRDALLAFADAIG